MRRLNLPRRQVISNLAAKLWWQDLPEIDAEAKRLLELKDSPFEKGK